MTRRILALTVTLLVLVTPARATDWRPDPADRLAALDADMAPLLNLYQPTFDAIVADFGALSAPFRFTAVAAAVPDMEARLDAAERLPESIAAALALAHDALAVLDLHPPEACWMDYGAVLRTGWVTYGDSADALRAGAMDDANRLVGIAVHLLGPYGTLVHGQAVEDCAA